jgi:hypothetical protein
MGGYNNFGPFYANNFGPNPETTLMNALNTPDKTFEIFPPLDQDNSQDDDT